MTYCASSHGAEPPTFCLFEPRTPGSIFSRSPRRCRAPKFRLLHVTFTIESPSERAHPRTRTIEESPQESSTMSRGVRKLRSYSAARPFDRIPSSKVRITGLLVAIARGSSDARTPPERDENGQAPRQPRRKMRGRSVIGVSISACASVPARLRYQTCAENRSLVERTSGEQGSEGCPSELARKPGCWRADESGPPKVLAVTSDRAGTSSRLCYTSICRRLRERKRWP